MKNNRLFGIIYLLLSKDTLTAKELADYFEVSVRTIYRDIESLCALDIPITMTKGKNGGIKLLENFKFDKTLLTEREQREILFSLQGINKLEITSPKTYEKLSNIFSKTDESWFEVDFSIWDNSVSHKEKFEMLKNSIIEKRVIMFSYFSSYGQRTHRKVEPLKLYFKHNSWYLCAFDLDKSDYRFFKIMRMRDLVVLDEIFDRVMDYIETEYDKPIETVDLVLKIDASQAYRVYDEFPEKSIEQQKDGHFLVSLSLPNTDWIYGYILSFGDTVEVIEPAFVKAEIIARLRKSLDNYS